MNSLQKMYPSLTTFSDLNWETVTREYEETAIEISFPEYLQLKAEEGDCPPYLYEMAYYELASFNAQTSDETFPYHPGIHLNPTALFLNFEFDIVHMLTRAKKGEIEVHERPHVLCLYRGKDDQVNSLELTDTDLELLQHLEEGPQMTKDFVTQGFQQSYETFTKLGLILEVH